MISFWSKRTAAAVALAAALFAVPAGRAAAAPAVVRIKMATLAPEGSAWYKILAQMGDDWKKASGGEVVLQIYPGGVVGDEDAMFRKMRVGQLQAAAVTGIGLATVDRSFYALHVPMMYASQEEFDYVRDRLSPMLERRLADKGYIVLNWGDAGWVHFFAKTPFTRPAEIKAMKLYVGAEDPTLVQLYKETGFRPVNLSIVDILPGLQTGLINAFDTTPLAALAFQWFALAPNMSDLKFAPLTGATVIDRRSWEKIPADLRPKILEASRAGGVRLRGEIRKLNEEAVKVMLKNGLKITHVPPPVEAEWRKLIEDIYPRIRGPIVPADAFDAALASRNAYRAANGKGARAR